MPLCFYSALQEGHHYPTHLGLILLLEDSLSNPIPEANYHAKTNYPCRMVVPSCLILGRSITSTENMEKDSATALFPCHDKTLAAVCCGFLEHPPGLQPWSEAAPQLLQAKEPFVLFCLATTFAVAPESYMGSMNFFLSTGTLPKLTSPKHDWLKVPQTVRERVVRERCSLSLEKPI